MCVTETLCHLDADDSIPNNRPSQRLPTGKQIKARTKSHFHS